MPALPAAHRLQPSNHILLARFSALGAVTYLATSALLVGAGAAHSDAPAQLWFLRTGVVLAIVVATVTATRNTRPRPSAIEQYGCACMGIGLPWLELTEFDQHVLSLYRVDWPLLDAALHGFGFSVIGSGVALLLVPRCARSLSAPSAVVIPGKSK